MRASSDPSTNQPLAHVMSVRMLVGVFLALIGLTVVTTAAAGIRLGEWDVWVALGIATIKASLVAAYYMHLRYDRPINLLVLMCGLAFLGLFIALTLVDSLV